MARIYTRREARARRFTFGIFAGMFDYAGVVVSILIIAVCVFLLYEVISWAIGDFDTSFGAIINMLRRAVVT